MEQHSSHSKKIRKIPVRLHWGMRWGKKFLPNENDGGSWFKTRAAHGTKEHKGQKGAKVSHQIFKRFRQHAAGLASFVDAERLQAFLTTMGTQV